MISTAEAVRLRLRAGEAVRFEVVTGSMAPTILAGDRIEVTPELRYRTGDVVVVDRPRGFQVHRLIQTGRVFRTRGDAVLWPDPPVAAERIIGRVNAVWRENRRTALPAFPWSLAPLLTSIVRVTGRLAVGRVRRTLAR